LGFTGTKRHHYHRTLYSKTIVAATQQYTTLNIKKQRKLIKYKNMLENEQSKSIKQFVMND